MKWLLVKKYLKYFILYRKEETLRSQIVQSVHICEILFGVRHWVGIQYLAETRPQKTAYRYAAMQIKIELVYFSTLGMATMYWIWQIQLGHLAWSCRKNHCQRWYKVAGLQFPLSICSLIIATMLLLSLAKLFLEDLGALDPTSSPLLFKSLLIDCKEIRNHWPGL